MRITNNTITRQYSANLNRNYVMLNNYSTQVTGQRINRMSEDVASGAKILQLKRNMSRLDSNIAAVKNAQHLYEAADVALQQASTLTSNVNYRFIEGITDGLSADDRSAIAEELRQYQEALLNLSNTKFSDRNLFGGTNTITNPFTLDDNGDLNYNGNIVTGLSKPVVDDFTTSYVDIGLGLSLNGQDVDPTTALAITFNGAEIFGYDDNNLYNLIGEMIVMLEADVPDHDAAGDLLNKFQSACSNITTALAKIGGKENYLDATLARMEEEQTLLTDKINNLLYKDSSLAIMEMTMQEYIYNAALAVGKNLFQPTLFNFIS